MFANAIIWSFSGLTHVIKRDSLPIFANKTCNPGAARERTSPFGEFPSDDSSNTSMELKKWSYCIYLPIT